MFDGNIHTLAVTWDSATGAIDVYVDGISGYSGTYFTGGTLDTGGTFALAQEQDSVGGGFDPNQIFQGTIYGVRLYDDVRTPAELTGSTHVPVADTSDPNLIANWVADPNLSTFTDHTGSHTMTTSGSRSSTWSADDDTLLGGDGADRILGGGGQDSIDGGIGNDSLDGDDGDDTIQGGTGADTIFAGEGDDSINAGDGDDEIFTEVGNDTVFGGAGNDSVYGWYVNSDLYIDGGDDYIDADDDEDLIIVEDGFGNDTILGGSGVDTGLDQDTLDFSEMTTLGVDVIFTDAEDGSVVGGADTLTFDNIEELVLTKQADTVDASADTLGVDILGGGGADSIIGGTGGDTIAGGDGDDYIDGGDGNDFLTTGEGQDTLFGGQGNDTLMNSDGDDSLDGGAGDDSIVATGGEDTLRGGTGDDYMDGGDDADTFIIEDSFGNDTIIGGEGTTDGTDVDYDTIDLSAMTGPVTVTYGFDNESGTITDGTDTITFSEIERIITTDQADSVDASDVFDGVFGDNPGIDIETRGGNDTIISGWGGDTIDGGTGNDSIDGDYGDDSLTGGDGDDTFTYSPGDGNDTITDFNAGNTGSLDDGDSTNNDFINLSGYYDHISELYADQADDGILNQSNANGHARERDGLFRQQPICLGRRRHFSGGQCQRVQLY